MLSPNRQAFSDSVLNIPKSLFLSTPLAHAPRNGGTFDDEHAVFVPLHRNDELHVDILARLPRMGTRRGAVPRVRYWSLGPPVQPSRALRSSTEGGATSRPSPLGPLIDFPAVADQDDPDDELAVPDFVNDPIVPDAVGPEWGELPLERFTEARLLGESFERLSCPSRDFVGQREQVFSCARKVKELVGHSSPKPPGVCTHGPAESPSLPVPVSSSRGDRKGSRQSRSGFPIPRRTRGRPTDGPCE